MLQTMLEGIFIFILKAMTLVVCCLFLVAPVLLVVRFLVAFIHDFLSRRRTV